MYHCKVVVLLVLFGVTVYGACCNKQCCCPSCNGRCNEPTPPTIIPCQCDAPICTKAIVQIPIQFRIRPDTIYGAPIPIPGGFSPYKIPQYPQPPIPIPDQYAAPLFPIPIPGPNSTPAPPIWPPSDPTGSPYVPPYPIPDPTYKPPTYPSPPPYNPTLPYYNPTAPPYPPYDPTAPPYPPYDPTAPYLPYNPTAPPYSPYNPSPPDTPTLPPLPPIPTLPTEIPPVYPTPQPYVDSTPYPIYPPNGSYPIPMQNSSYVVPPYPVYPPAPVLIPSCGCCDQRCTCDNNCDCCPKCDDCDNIFTPWGIVIIVVSIILILLIIALLILACMFCVRMCRRRRETHPEPHRIQISGPYPSATYVPSSRRAEHSVEYTAQERYYDSESVATALAFSSDKSFSNMSWFRIRLLFIIFTTTQCYYLNKRSIYQQNQNGQGKFIEPGYSPYQPAVYPIPPVQPDYPVQPTNPSGVYPVVPPGKECEQCIVSWNDLVDWMKDGGAVAILIVLIVIGLLLCLICCLACGLAGAFGATRVNAQEPRDRNSEQTPPKK
ncbi:unnamed protein product [Bursaphelenchus okinawaensis]|uniref:Uncharacterized protein n=1 Tax=Bursaphelenchus okinawaensis TaxID=465554 RepID=A0A811LCU9_9BILA|nr:unnamed protein product [Bursaphelenchus okinawaensis]CAG9120429.1 unnamed protein product [Bursaphelenchus okinawaensis]